MIEDPILNDSQLFNALLIGLDLLDKRGVTGLIINNKTVTLDKFELDTEIKEKLRR